MNEVQPLISSILEEAHREAEQIREEGRLKVRAIEEKSQAKAEDRRAELLDQAEKKAREEKSRQKIQAQLGMRRELLETKNKLIAEVFDTVQERLAQMEEGAYRRLMLRLLLDAVQTDGEELILSPKDHTRLGRNFLDEVCQELKKDGRKGELTLGAADSGLQGGFLLRQGKVVQNYSLENLVSSKREELLPEIGKRLFSTS